MGLSSQLGIMCQTGERSRGIKARVTWKNVCLGIRGIIATKKVSFVVLTLLFNLYGGQDLQRGQSPCISQITYSTWQRWPAESRTHTHTRARAHQTRWSLTKTQQCVCTLPCKFTMVTRVSTKKPVSTVNFTVVKLCNLALATNFRDVSQQSDTILKASCIVSLWQFILMYFEGNCDYHGKGFLMLKSPFSVIHLLLDHNMASTGYFWSNVLVLGLVYSTQSAQCGNVEFVQVKVCCNENHWLCLNLMCCPPRLHFGAPQEHHKHS